MKKRLFLYTTLIIIAGLLCFFAVSVYLTSVNNLSMAKETVVEITHIYANFYTENIDLATFDTDPRITIVASDGTVLADSHPLDVTSMDNHLSRPEIQAALAGYPETFVRRSESLGVDFIYYALKIDSGDDYIFIRTALPVESVNEYLLGSLPLLALVLCAVILLCFVVSRSMITRIIKPFENVAHRLQSVITGNYIPGLAYRKEEYEEVEVIVNKIDDVAEVLQNYMSELRDEKTKAEYVLRKNAMQREEFFANASHELKTPLTAIKGFNELISLHNKDEGIAKYIHSITREINRMLSLIEDMLKLSELENAQEPNPVLISLRKITEEIWETLSTSIVDKGIVFSIVGDAVIKAEQEHIYELLKNLIENAVRYNEQNGSVTVRIDNVRLLVSDTGIGIPLNQQVRIFERFHRVEKSRSQKSGGTGLGLSIVKHICALYGWKLSLKSKLGVGTEIMVEFGE